jgi:hypothetical protein
VAAGWDHTVGLTADGTAIAAGWNLDGQCNVSRWTNLVAVAAGDLHTVGLKADGTVVAAGRNSERQCNVTDWNLGPCATGSYAFWTTRTRLPTNRRGVADCNGPLGLPNLLAYALGLNPFTAQTHDLPSLTLRGGGDSRTVAFTYRLSKTAEGLSVDLLGATALLDGPWLPVGRTPVQIGETADGQADLWQIELPVDSPARFFRLRATER